MTRRLVSLGVLGAILALTIAYLSCLPKDLFEGETYSTVVTDRNGELLGARIAKDGQWRFPECDTVPRKFRVAIIEFEDRWFALHPGFNPVSMARAAFGNVRAGKVTSGGSTISMQVIRMSRGRERTVTQKIVETILATRLELRHSKNRILALYASHAPFGGNVVGLEAAAWRYYGKPAGELSWGETATLAVLPNAPSDIHPGKNRELLRRKRDRLLDKIHEDGYMDEIELELAKDEPLPSLPEALPNEAYHLTERYRKEAPGKRSRTDIDIQLQRRLNSICDRWNDELSFRGIEDLAAVVIDVKTGKTLAYVGNANPGRKRPGSDVDIARAPRSTGSVLKPFLYCASLQEGDILPNSLLPDTPVNIGGFSPQNFDRKFEGAVPASEALARSLNVPSVHLLRRYGVPRFLDLLRDCGLTTLGKSASYYGLSLILGGGECDLWEITKAYAGMALSYESPDSLENKAFPLKDKCALWHTIDALKDVNRPDEMDWRLVTSVKKVAWKTGTSYGFRDAWSVGFTSDYAVGVWAGNARGQGVPGLVGARAAAPVMFDIFNALPNVKSEGSYHKDGWFLEPVYGDYIKAEVCHESGHLKGPDCEIADTVILPRKAMRSAPCPYHKSIDGVRTFILPPSMEWYYRQRHPEYHPYVPTGGDGEQLMEFIYPENGSVVYIPRQLDGSVAGVTFNLAHRSPSATVYWHLDNEYAGKTRFIHQMNLSPAPGRHTVTVVDESGVSVSVGFTVAENKKKATL